MCNYSLRKLAVTRCAHYGSLCVHPPSTACRYIMKDKQEPHFSLLFMCGGTDRAFLERCLQDYQTVASRRYNKYGQLQPDNFMKAVATYTNKHLTPLDIHPLITLRLMLLEKHYQLGETWCKPGVNPHACMCLVLQNSVVPCRHTSVPLGTRYTLCKSPYYGAPLLRCPLTKVQVHLGDDRARGGRFL